LDVHFDLSVSAHGQIIYEGRGTIKTTKIIKHKNMSGGKRIGINQVKLKDFGFK